MAQTTNEDRQLALDAAVKLNSVTAESGTDIESSKVVADAQAYADFLSNG